MRYNNDHLKEKEDGTPSKQPPIDLAAYAGDADDDQLARDQANQYMDDLSRAERNRVREHKSQQKEEQ